MGPLRGASYREVDTFMIRPSEDIAAIAARHMELDNIAERCGGVLKFLLKRMLAAGAGPAGETISYLLFDGQYAQDLIRLGMQDADAKRQQIIDFFS